MHAISLKPEGEARFPVSGVFDGKKPDLWGGDYIYTDMPDAVHFEETVGKRVFIPEIDPTAKHAGIRIGYYNGGTVIVGERGYYESRRFVALRHKHSWFVIERR